MRLDLHKIIEVPGEVRFDAEFNAGDYADEAEFLSPLNVKGSVVNSADVLTLRAAVSTKMRCRCDRCATEFDYDYNSDFEAILTSELQDEDNPDMFLIADDAVDLEEIITTLFILEMDSKLLCRPDCMGLCADCGKNLNEGLCSCKKEIDPRLAALGQLLEP